MIVTTAPKKKLVSMDLRETTPPPGGFVISGVWKSGTRLANHHLYRRLQSVLWLSERTTALPLAGCRSTRASPLQGKRPGNQHCQHQVLHRPNQGWPIGTRHRLSEITGRLPPRADHPLPAGRNNQRQVFHRTRQLPRRHKASRLRHKAEGA